MIRLAEAEWREREAEHERRADDLTAGWRSRAHAGAGGGRLTHPVEDFLHTYYPYRPALLRRWHPGSDVVLAGDGRRDAKWYVEHDGGWRVDTAAFAERHRAAVGWTRGLLERTASRQPNLGCFGMHEWAMVYRADETRHEVPLRLGGDGTDRVVEGHRISCSHFDAFRFFTPEAVDRNHLQPTRETQAQLEQPGCLHAGMDLYKWAAKLGPLLPGELLLDTFELARDIRVLDMRASPYDLADHGYEPVPVETAEGKAEYGRQQRLFADRGADIRRRILDALP